MLIDIKDISNLKNKLFPIYRSITGHGVIQTLDILNEVSPLKIVNFNTGKRFFDWKIPEEWNVEDAFVSDSCGNKLIDFKRCNLHLVGYSIPFVGWVTSEELEKHLYSLPQSPNWIPYVTSYYKKDWGFCIAHNERYKLTDNKYFVCIKSSFKNGHLNVGEILIKGKSKKEILISCNICHPSMANNEISGMVVAINLAKIIRSQKNFYSYRFVFSPETIGAIAYIGKNLKKLKKEVIAGYQLTCIGDRANMSYLTSRFENCLSDRVALHVLKNTQENVKIHSFLDRGSDERQYCFPGVDIPIGSLMRSRYDTYPEYHTSADDLNFISNESLADSIEKCYLMVTAIEKNQKYMCTKKCEPHFQKYNLYPSISTKNTINVVKFMRNVLTYCDGKTDILSIAEKMDVPIFDLYEVIDEFVKKGLIKRV